MSMKEVAVYFDVLRQRRDISQPTLAKMLGVTVRQVQRWTVEGVSGMKFDNVYAMVQALQGSMDDVLRLMQNDATPELARDLVSGRIGEETMQKIQTIANDLTRNEIDIMEVVGELRAHPELIRPTKSLLAGADLKPQPGRKRKTPQE